MFFKIILKSDILKLDKIVFLFFTGINDENLQNELKKKREQVKLLSLANVTTINGIA